MQRSEGSEHGVAMRVRHAESDGPEHESGGPEPKVASVLPVRQPLSTLEDRQRAASGGPTAEGEVQKEKDRVLTSCGGELA